MNTTQYLNRIQYEGPLEPTLEALHALQKQHLLTVPFENLDIHSGCPLSLDPNALFEKIVVRNRGGFCYELNGLFYELLSELGFSVKRVSGRVFNADNGEYGEPFDHLALLVAIQDKEYIADVGFGEFTMYPLKLQPGMMQFDGLGRFVIQQHDSDQWRVSKWVDEDWLPQYLFETERRNLIEFQGMCRYHQTSPDSHFAQKKMVSRLSEHGRVSIAGQKLIVRKGDEREEHDLASEQDWLNALAMHFSIPETSL